MKFPRILVSTTNLSIENWQEAIEEGRLELIYDKPSKSYLIQDNYGRIRVSYGRVFLTEKMPTTEFKELTRGSSASFQYKTEKQLKKYCEPVILKRSTPHYREILDALKDQLIEKSKAKAESIQKAYDRIKAAVERPEFNISVSGEYKQSTPLTYEEKESTWLSDRLQLDRTEID